MVTSGFVWNLLPPSCYRKTLLCQHKTATCSQPIFFRKHKGFVYEPRRKRRAFTDTSCSIPVSTLVFSVAENVYNKTEIGRPKPSVTGKPGKLDFSRSGTGTEQAEKQGRGGVAVKVKPKRKTRKEKKEELEHNWRVLLHNDDIHTFDYVISAIVSVVKVISRKKAHRVTMEAHSCGVSTVTTTWKQLAEEYCLGLQRYGLTTSIAPDSLFKP
eukprot:jgi/Galph1/4427/GphlegSOOS_G3030.1